MLPSKLLLSLLLSWGSQTQCLADVMYAEARGESEEQRIAVAAVVINRAVADNRSICSVTKMPHQFVSKHASARIEASLALVIYLLLPDHYKNNYHFHSGEKIRGKEYDKIEGGNKFYPTAEVRRAF